MTDARVFACPSCGASLTPPADNDGEMKCPYCGNTVVIPPELQGPRETSLPKTVVFQVPAEPAEPVVPLTLPVDSRLPRLIIAFVVAISACIICATLAPVIGMTVAMQSLFSGVLGPLDPVNFTSGGSYAHVVLSFGGQGTAPGLFQRARRVAVDGSGNIYVSDADTLRIQKFDPTGKFVSLWTIDDPNNRKTSPDELAADRAGHVYVAWNQSILKYDGASGALLATLSGEGYRGVTVLADGSLLTRSNKSGDDTYVRLDATGQVVARFPKLVSTQVGSSVSPSELHLAVDGLGTLFVLNSSEGSVYKFTPEGKYVTKFGSKGKGTGQFTAFTNLIAVDNRSRVYANDSAGIEVFDPTGRYLDNINSLFYSGAMQDLKITDKNEIFVVDGASKILKLAMSN